MKDKRKFLGLLLAVMAGVIFTANVVSCNTGTGAEGDPPTKFEGTWFFDERPERNRTVTYVFTGNSFASTNVFNDDTMKISGTFTFDDANIISTYSDTFIMNGVEIPFDAESMGMTNPSSNGYSFSEDNKQLTIGSLTYTKQE